MFLEMSDTAHRGAVTNEYLKLETDSESSLMRSIATRELPLEKSFDMLTQLTCSRLSLHPTIAVGLGVEANCRWPFEM